MRTTVNKTPQQVVIRLSGRFDFEARRDFDLAVREALDDKARQVYVNLSEVEYMDSSALGMLLVLRDKAIEAGKQVAVGEAQGFVKKILEVANFQKLFDPA